MTETGFVWGDAAHRTAVRIENGMALVHMADDPAVLAWLKAGNSIGDAAARGVAPTDKNAPVRLYTQTLAGSDLRLTLYRFPQKGVQLAMHEHTFAHYSFRLNGSFLVTLGDGTQRTLADVGAWTLFPAGVRHEITALEPESLCLQVQPHVSQQSVR